MRFLQKRDPSADQNTDGSSVNQSYNCRGIRLLEPSLTAAASLEALRAAVFLCRTPFGSGLIDDGLCILECSCSGSGVLSFYRTTRTFLTAVLTPDLTRLCSLLLSSWSGYDSLLGRFDVCHFISSEIKLFSNKYVFRYRSFKLLSRQSLSAAGFPVNRITVQPRKQSADLQEYRQKDTRTSAKTYL